MTALNDLINKGHAILDEIRVTTEPYQTYAIYGYPIERCPNALLEKYIKLAEEHIAKKRLDLCAFYSDLELRDILKRDTYEEGLLCAQEELKMRKHLGIKITKVKEN